MKKLLTALCIVMVSISACSDNSTKETTESKTTETNTTETKKADSREQEIKDSTTMLDKKLADPNSNYSPDSLK
jgi:hypothetical protein